MVGGRSPPVCLYFVRAERGGPSSTPEAWGVPAPRGGRRRGAIPFAGAGAVLTIAFTLDQAMERLRKNHYELWLVMREVRAAPSVVEGWRRAPEGSQEWRKAVQHRHASMVLGVSTSD